MRLINTDTLEMEFFLSASAAPPYAILSHTWESEEVTFQDYTNPVKDIREDMKGYQKIVKSCELAKQQGLPYVWVDTCCIDKSSSAELTEAINSMYQWYKGSVVCYAWLADLPSDTAVPLTGKDGALQRCRWFTRGWTLQELIAPPQVQFYDAEWAIRGTRIDWCDVISEITNISQAVLLEPVGLDTLAVAERMSWAANRRTTREEDVAYCLLGIFNVNMPMLYGEGKRAFIRLQEEIAKESNDMSLFAWRAADDRQKHRGMIAESPDEFARGGGTKLVGNTVLNPEFTITNKGIKMSCDVYPGAEGMFVIMLNCTQVIGGKDRPVGIWVKGHGDTVHSRVIAHLLGSLREGSEAKNKLVYVLKTVSPSLSDRLSSSHAGGFMFRKNFNSVQRLDHPNFYFRGARFSPESAWDSQRNMFVTGGHPEFHGHVLFVGYSNPGFPRDKLSMGNAFLVRFGGSDDEDSEPWITIDNTFGNPEIYKAVNGQQAVAKVAKGDRKQSAALRTKRGELGPKVWVKMEKDVVEGGSVYCIDLDMEREWEEYGLIVRLDNATEATSE